MWVFVAVGVLWLAGWFVASRKDAADKQANTVSEIVESNLALPVNSYEDYKLLIGYAKSINADTMTLRKDIHLVPKGYEIAPFRWRGFTIYLKRNA